MNAPKVRFKEFHDPWVVETLEAVTSIFKSGSGITSAKITETGEFPVFGGNGLRGYTNLFTHDGTYALIGRQGALCGNIKKVAGKTFISEHAIAVQGNQKASTDWLALKLDLMNLNRLSESSAQPGLAVNKLLKLKINIPAINEQEKIASFISAVDEKIRLLEEKHSLLLLYKKSVAYKIFNQSIRFKKNNGEPYPIWKNVALGTVATTFSGGTPATSKRSYYGGDIPFIKSGEIGDKQTAQSITSEGLKNSSAKMVKSGDLLFALYGATSGEVAIAKLDGAINQAVLCIRSELNNHFLCSYFEFKKNQIIGKYIQGGQGNLSAEIVKSLSIPVPCAEEQSAIANFLIVIDSKIDYIKQQLDITKQFKKALLQQMFI